MDALHDALAALGLGQHVDAFRAADIDLEVLPLLGEADLKELGLSLGQRRKLLAAISTGRLKPPSAEAPQPGGAPATDQEQLRQLTALVCDLVGSTEMMQRLDPEAMGRIVREFQELAASVITRFEGFVERFSGDSVLAFFGYPHAHEDAAERAVRAGLAIIEALRGVRVPGGGLLMSRAAVASGDAYFGERVERAGIHETIVIGEVINLACRMQSVAPENGLIVSPRTRAQLREWFDLDDLGAYEFKGIGRPVNVWLVTGVRSVSTRFEATQSRVLSPIVGREAEIALLCARWEAACSGEGQVVLLSGDAGIGKSRIAHAVSDRVGREPHLTIRYQCSSFHLNSALYPVVAQLQFAAGIKAADPPGLQLSKLEALVATADVPLAEHVPPLADLLSIPLGETYPPLDRSAEARKRATLRVLREQLLALAARHPVLFMFEDAHWIDPTTAELITSVVMSIQSARVLLLMTSRPGFNPEWAGLPYVTTLALSGLS
ncbi:MAG TPA: AAA family ATPase, partial [Solirubrobacteraceae bacterium]